MSEIVKRQNKYEGNKTTLNGKKINGLEIKPKNKIKYDVEVNSMLVVNQTYIEQILRKKTKRKLEYCLRYIMALIDGEEEASSPDNLKLALDDLAHYKSIIEYKYRKYLDEKYINILLQKIDMLSHEIKIKLASFHYSFEEEKEVGHKVR